MVVQPDLKSDFMDGAVVSNPADHQGKELQGHTEALLYSMTVIHYVAITTWS